MQLIIIIIIKMEIESWKRLATRMIQIITKKIAEIIY
jgi:hypothetical protein